MASPTSPAPTRGAPASRPSDPIPHSTSVTTIDTTPATTATITPPPDTPTSRYSVVSRASSSSSSGLDYYSHTSPPPLSSQVYDHRHSTSTSGHEYHRSYDQAQVRESVYRKPVPLPSQDQHASPVIDPVHLSSPFSIKNKPPPIPSSAAGSISPSSVEGGDSFVSAPRNSNRYSRGRHPAKPLRIDTTPTAAFLRSVVEDEDDDDDESADYFDEDYEHQFTNGSGFGTPLHSRLVSEPFIPILNSPPPAQRRATSMALHPPTHRPPPLQIDVDPRSMSMGHADPKQPKTPGNKISSFFGWKANTATSPGAESSSTEISDGGRSPMPSPMPPLANVPMRPPSSYDTKPGGFGPPARTPSLGTLSAHDTVYASKLADLENELREISSELAGSIRREMELEDLIERFQTEGPEVNRRTSDYFSDSGTSSIRYGPDRHEDIEKIRRGAEQERAQLKAEFSLRLQEERVQRAASESHVQILENQVQQLRRERTDLSDLSSKTKELETALENTRRKLLEERQSKDNFEDLLTAMRVELEQLRNERDILREGKAAPVVEAPPAAEMQRLIEEIEALKIENASLAQLQGGRFASIAEEDGVQAKRNSAFGLSRANSLARKPTSGLARSGSLSRSNSVSNNKDRETSESLVDKVKDIETQRDALHRTLRSLLSRHAYQEREFEKHVRLLEAEVRRAQEAVPPRKLGYEREVRSLRDEVNHLRLRAEDALDGKWQCEKNLAGLKMDLDRAEQETSSLRVLLQEHDIEVPEWLEADQESFAEVMATSSSLESAFQQLQADRQQAEASGESADLEAINIRSNELAGYVHQQLQVNSSLRGRLATAIEKGERDQQISVERINTLQNRMKELEENLLNAQNHSEEELGKHEEEIRLLKENHNAQLQRMKNGSRTPASLSPRPPNTPFAGRSPRLDQTTSGEGVPLATVVRAEVLEKHVKALERAIRDVDMEMEEVVGRMNRAQVDVAQLQSDRDEALRQTRRLQADIQAERETLRSLM
ncbi:hypothetical protein PMG11_07542 [Penicillium brasilianum]|uniref:DUF7603 domain-containing protein n=1 Tax=Penicillium brasilianum TaxID=104259 RepID=A0A0F7TUT4_PENBI|nr:hypothetical protein PMG11_07542 [Penicillium brasilianum]